MSTALAANEAGSERWSAPSAHRRPAADAALWLARVGKTDTAHLPASELSPGQAHRVALARALATDPTLLLLDEPFAELDPRTRASLHEELLAVWTATRKTIVLATHDPIEAVMLADRVVVLSPSPGRIVAEFRIDVPRPRRADDPALLARARDLSAGVQTRAA
jgi:NitT/TauT family transport system ATP-binding protein